jgi:glycosyltransferase 2 family protein
MTKKRVLALVVILLLLYVVVPRLGSFSESFAVVRSARPAYVAAALVVVAMTFVFAAAIYWTLALKHLPYIQTLHVQVASAFTNRLLPAGLGTVTLYVQYLRKCGHRLSQAIAVAGMNSLLSMVGHLIILAVVLLATDDVYPDKVSLPSAGVIWLVAGGLVLIVAANILVFRKLRQFAYNITQEVVSTLRFYRQRPGRLVKALLFCCLLTVSYVTVFYLCVAGVGLDVSVAHVFLVFTIGLIAGTATPTPGGLIGAEAGLTGGLIAYGVPADQALAAALLYRFLTYWLPLLPGFIVFVRIRRLYS